MIPPPPRTTLFPYTTLFRSTPQIWTTPARKAKSGRESPRLGREKKARGEKTCPPLAQRRVPNRHRCRVIFRDRKSTRLNSSHVRISYAVFCLKKKKDRQETT